MKEQKLCEARQEAACLSKADCQDKLDQVLPLLTSASQTLDAISKDHMVQLKSFLKPPPSAAVVMEGICYAFDEEKFVKGNQGAKDWTQNFWNYAKRKLLNDHLIHRIKAFKEEQIKKISPKNMQKLKAFLQHPLFEEEKVKKSSFAAYSLSMWIRTVVATYDALMIVEPQRLELELSDLSLREA